MLVERPADPLSRLLSLLENVRETPNGWMARCPAHDDKHPSLSLNQGEDGSVLLKCFAGCSAEAVVGAVGLRLRDLFPQGAEPANKPSLGEPVAHYDYYDRDGRTLLYQVIRYRPKTFRCRRPDGRGGWSWNLQGATRVLYRLAELQGSAARKETVFIVEGEKDVENLRKIGVTATTNVGGAGKWLPCYSEALRGRHVCILPDNDDAGRQHAASVARALLDTAASLRVLELADLPAKGDVSDWLGGSHNHKRLLELAAQAPLARDWLAPANAPSPRQDNEQPQADSLLLRVADVVERPVHWLWPGRLALGKLAILDGDPGLGKSLVTLDLCARVTQGRALADEAAVWPGDVVIVNCEDGVGDTIRPRLRGLGADLNRVHLLRGPIRDGREQLPCFPRDLPRLQRAVDQCRAVLVVIDPIMAFLDEGICTSNDQSVRQALTPLAAMAEATGCAVFMVRHLNKTGGAKAIYRGGGSIGIVGACRSAWLIGRHPDDERQRVLAQTKNNLARPQPSLVYQVESGEGDQPRVRWLGATELTADDLMGAAGSSGGGSELDRAADLLRQALSNGPRPASEVIAELKRQGVSRRTAFRAKCEVAVAVEMVKTAAGAHAVWQLQASPPGATEEKTPTQKALEILNRDMMPPYLQGR